MERGLADADRRVRPDGGEAELPGNILGRCAIDSDAGDSGVAAGAAVITRGSWGLALGQWEERLVETWLAGARSSLDAESAAACWRIGEAMPLEELVSYALTEPLLSHSTSSRKPE